MENHQSQWEKQFERRIERRVEWGFKKFVHFFFHFVFGAAIAAAFGVAVMWLWNCLLPDLLGVAVIGFWQALGLLVLCRILFGNFSCGRIFGGGRGGFHKNPFREKWMRMSPEERKEFLHHHPFGHRFGRDFCNEQPSENKD